MKLPNPHSSIVNVAEQESAPWMTMVHAASHDQRFFSAQINAFQQDYRLLLVDLPGHGKSAAMPGPYGFEEYATSVLAAMEESRCSCSFRQTRRKDRWPIKSLKIRSRRDCDKIWENQSISPTRRQRAGRLLHFAADLLQASESAYSTQFPCFPRSIGSTP